MNLKQFLMKFDRFCAWLLVAIMVAFFVSGYGETKGIIPVIIAKLLHETILPIPGAIAFAFHSAYGMHISFKRWKIWGPVPRFLLIVYSIILIGGIFVFEFVVQKPGGNIPVPQKIELN